MTCLLANLIVDRCIFANAIGVDIAVIMLSKAAVD
jgi:hypothetical protein